jgi:uncharacterized repeat protein (TIGR01451 family)
MTCRPPATCHARPRLRLLRIIAIVISAIVLCSCRSLSLPGAGVMRVEATGEHALFSPDECATGQCQTAARGEPTACGPVAACVPIIEPPPPLALPCPVCDGGDHGAPAKPVGGDAIGNLTMGDTVARYRPAGAGPDADDVCITASNCTCVYAPKFASVRQVDMPSERSAPLGVLGLAQDDLVLAEVRLDPVRDRVQNLSLEAARRAEPGVGLEERLGPLAVDQAELPDGTDHAEAPAARVAEVQPLRADRLQSPLQIVGFDVPMAWTCVKAANVLVNSQTPQVVASHRGTATLRFEVPGRAELTICKQAGSDTARVGEELDFTIFVLNSGDRALDDIVLVDALPDRLTLIPESPAASLPADVSTETADDGSVVVKWRFRDPLPPGASGFVRFRTIVK